MVLQNVALPLIRYQALDTDVSATRRTSFDFSVTRVLQNRKPQDDEVLIVSIPHFEL